MIGTFKDRITVKFLMKNDNGRGSWTNKEVEQGTFWGRIEPMSARNIVQYRQADLNTNTKIVMRKDPATITRNHVLYARGLKYSIDEVIEKEGFYHIFAVGEIIGE
jgi:SPP1 family predicted phage head-tail adaptor